MDSHNIFYVNLRKGAKGRSKSFQTGDGSVSAVRHKTIPCLPLGRLVLDLSNISAYNLYNITAKCRRLGLRDLSRTERRVHDDSYFQQLMSTGVISIRPVHETDGLFMIQSDGKVYEFVMFAALLLSFLSVNLAYAHSSFALYVVLLIVLGCLLLWLYLLTDGISYVFFLDRVELRLQGITFLRKNAKRRQDGVEDLFDRNLQRSKRRGLRFRTLPRDRLAGVKGSAGEMILLEKRRHSDSALPLWLQKLCRPFGTMLLFVPKKEAKQVYELLWGYVSGANPHFEDVE